MKLGWDVALPSHLQCKWASITQSLSQLDKYLVRRPFSQPSHDGDKPQHHLFGFSDASNHAYAAVVYMRTVTKEGAITISLIAAKTKVAPVKGETTPRLELNGARLLSSLLKTVREALVVSVDLIVCFCDSTSVLGWINQSSSSLDSKDVYVRNRVRHILRTLPQAQWYYIKGSENPADCASRGIKAQEFLSLNLWAQGPPWLPGFSPPLSSLAHASVLTHKVENPFLTLTLNISSLQRLKRVVATVCRFVVILKTKTKVITAFSAKELEKAFFIIISAVQKQEFAEEIKGLASHNTSPPKKLKFLAPYVDDHGILRVGGRLRNADITMDTKHPILLPKDHHLTRLIARHLHQLHGHAGPSLLLCLVRERFWIPGGPIFTKNIVRSCVTCHRHKPQPLSQVMADLTEPRVSLFRPFTNTGMDYAGPFMLTAVPERRQKLLKSYLCVFVCMATKAIHLELVGDLTTASFLAALKRFSSRRGLPKNLYSDNGKNFIGAKNELDRVVSLFGSSDFQKTIMDFCSGQGVIFNLNPPLSPHHGGLYEAAVKSIKYHLRRIIGDRHLSLEEMGTVLCQTEEILNSRPLTPLSSDPSDFGALTPAHFLTGGPLHSIPEEDLTQKKTLKRWEATTHIIQLLRRRFQLECIQLLQSRPK